MYHKKWGSNLEKIRKKLEKIKKKWRNKMHIRANVKRKGRPLSKMCGSDNWSHLYSLIFEKFEILAIKQ